MAIATSMRIGPKAVNKEIFISPNHLNAARITESTIPIPPSLKSILIYILNSYSMITERAAMSSNT